MELSTGHAGHEPQIIELFGSTFAASEGADEGALVGKLVKNIMATTTDENLLAFTAREDGQLVGCIFFTPLTYPRDSRSVRLLSPVAVTTDRQNSGIGQKLIKFALETLKQQQVDVVVTYGDPRYYSKVGFAQISEEVAEAPFKLQHPQGWQAQSLTSQALEPLAGPSQCIDAFRQPELW